jgi:hypothetical protein
VSSKSQDIANEDLFAGIEYNEAIVGALSTIHESLVAFSEMADSKANIMITVCSILLGLAVAKIEQGVLVLPLSFFILCCVPALTFAILTVLPAKPPRRGQVSDVQHLPHFNPLFFMHFSLVPLKIFKQEIHRTISNPQQLYDGLTTDIYYAGIVIGTKKFRYLRWSYLSLLAGVALGGLAVAASLIL